MLTPGYRHAERIDIGPRLEFGQSWRDNTSVATQSIATKTGFKAALIAFIAAFGMIASAQQSTPRELGLKYVRDSSEYATLARQTYRVASDAVPRLVSGLAGRQWAVVLDVDETVLDNSTYQLERAAYGLPFDAASWSAWVQRREASAVPGAIDFIIVVRKLGGQVAWITNRATSDAGATRENLKSARLWSEDDRLCTQDHEKHTKRTRRAEVVAGTGACAWAGKPTMIVALVGDQMGDFPDTDEPIRDAGTDSAFGRTFFMLPNPMYGAWTTRVTRDAR